jgi:predicted dinucleotide-binding enzyme
MRIWLIGAGQIGTAILRQLHKNPDITVVVSDPSPSPQAVQEGVIEKVDLVETVTPVSVNRLARRIRPDLILLSPPADDKNLSALEGGQAMAQALHYEISVTSEYPVIILSQSNIR